MSGHLLEPGAVPKRMIVEAVHLVAVSRRTPYNDDGFLTMTEIVIVSKGW